MTPVHPGGRAEAFASTSQDPAAHARNADPDGERSNPPRPDSNSVTPAELQAAIRNIPDFPTAGIQFKDITPLLADPRLLSGSVDLLAGNLRPGDVDLVAGIDARGFLFASPLAIKLGAGVVPVRKKGKLPFQTIEQAYELEYGLAHLTIHVDAIRPGHRVLLVDDVLATGGTAAATISLIERLGGSLVETVFLMELGFLNGRSRLAGRPVRSLVQF